MSDHPAPANIRQYARMSLYDQLACLAPDELVTYRYRGTPAEQVAAAQVLRDLHADGDPTFGSRHVDGDRGYQGQ